MLALALGARTEKMDRGHRGGNHPVQDLTTGKVEITSQNHGFVVSETDLPGDLEVTHRSLFDGSIEGLGSGAGRSFPCNITPKPRRGEATVNTCSRVSPICFAKLAVNRCPNVAISHQS